MNRNRPTMLDVAEESGTSLKTVSRVVNGESGVNPELVAKVERAVKKLHYRHNLTAGSLRRLGGKTKTIGLLLENVSNPFSAALHRSVEDSARSRGIDVLTGSLDGDLQRERDLINGLVARRVDGLIVVPSSDDHKYLNAERKAGTQFVFIDRPALNFISDTVTATNSEGVEEAVTSLVKLGHKRIAYLGDAEAIFTAKERHNGYRKALRAAKIPIDKDIEKLGFADEGEIESFLIGLLSRQNRPTAIFTGQNIITLVAIRVLRAKNLHHKIALIGFDDLPLADLLDPAIALVTQDIHVMGSIAAKLLFDRIDGVKSPFEERVVPTTFAQRASGLIKP
jgi:LacI family transcriptional regulator